MRTGSSRRPEGLGKEPSVLKTKNTQERHHRDPQCGVLPATDGEPLRATRTQRTAPQQKTDGARQESRVDVDPAPALP